MRQYAAKRIGLFVPTVLLITIMVFVVIRLIPGDPALAILSEGEASYTQEDLLKLRQELGTDRPMVVQYFDWIGGALKGDFGDSFLFRAPVMAELQERIPVTIELAGLAMLIAVVVAVPLGILSAIKPDSTLDYIARGITLVGIAVPNFLVAILMILLLLFLFNWLPAIGYVSLWDDPFKNLQQMIFPALALGFYDMAFIARVTRSSMLEVLREDYMRTARSKGLKEMVVVVRHALKNAILPVITISGYQFGRLLGGVIITEVIFVVPGVGTYLVDAIIHRDFVVLQGIILLTAALILVVNLVIDLMYGVIDPRIRYS